LFTDGGVGTMVVPDQVGFDGTEPVMPAQSL